MANPAKHLNERPDDETSALAEQFRRDRPLYQTNDEAARALGRELETLAGLHDMNIETLLNEAHTTTTTQDFHRLALKLERQIAFLRR